MQAAADPNVFVKETSRSRKAVVFSKLICPSCRKAKEVRLRDVVCPAPGAHTGHSSGAAAAAAGSHNHNKKMPAHLPPLATDACAAACPCHPQIMSKHLPSEQYTIIELDTRPDCDQLQDALERLTVSGEGLCGLGARGSGLGARGSGLGGGPLCGLFTVAGRHQGQSSGRRHPAVAAHAHTMVSGGAARCRPPAQLSQRYSSALTPACIACLLRREGTHN